MLSRITVLPLENKKALKKLKDVNKRRFKNNNIRK